MVLELVLSQIQAWNDGNLNKLMSYYSDTIEVYKQPSNEVVLKSKDQILAHIKADFEAKKVQKVNVISKTEMPPYVVLVEEKQTPNGPKKALVTYLVENNKIQKMWIGQ